MYGSTLCVEHFRNIAPTTHTCAAIVLVQSKITVELRTYQTPNNAQRRSPVTSFHRWNICCVCPLCPTSVNTDSTSPSLYSATNNSTPDAVQHILSQDIFTVPIGIPLVSRIVRFHCTTMLSVPPNYKKLKLSWKHFYKQQIQSLKVLLCLM